MSQKVRIIGVKLTGTPFVGCLTPTDADGNRVSGPAAPTWTADPDKVMAWLCEGYRSRFNSYRAWRGRAVWEDDPDAEPSTDRRGRVRQPRRRITDSSGEPFLVALGSDPTWEKITEVRANHPHMSALPDMLLQAPQKLENEDWWSAIARRATLRQQGKKPGRPPGFRRKNSDARFVIWSNNGRNATFTRTGRRAGLVTITGMNPPRWKGGRPSRWSVKIRVRYTQPVRDYTSVRVNWTTRELVFVNPPTPVGKKATGSAVGLDLGVTRTIATSDGDFYDQPDTADLDARIYHHSKRMAKSRLVNNPTKARNWTPTKGYLRHKNAYATAHAARTRRLNDWRHKVTTDLIRSHDLIGIEDLNVANMTKSAKGTLENPGKQVAQKAGLNRSLAQSAFSTLRAMLAYKTDVLIQHGHDQYLLAVPPKNTSRRCNTCGHTAKENRKSQAVFSCRACGHTANADTNASANVLDAALQLWGWTTDASSAGTGTPVAPAGSKGKTDPSKEVLDTRPGGTCDEPRTTRT